MTVMVCSTQHWSPDNFATKLFRSLYSHIWESVFQSLHVIDQDSSMATELMYRPTAPVCHSLLAQSTSNSMSIGEASSSIFTAQPSSTSRSNFAVASLEFSTNPRCPSVNSKITPRNTEQHPVFRHPRSRHLVVQSAHTLPRSVSVADLLLDENLQKTQSGSLKHRLASSSLDGFRRFASKQDITGLTHAHAETLLSAPTDSRGMLKNNRCAIGGLTGWH